MGDHNTQTQPQPLDNGGGHGPHHFDLSSTSPYKPAPDYTPFYSQLSSLPNTQVRPEFRTSMHTSPHTAAHDHDSSLFNMSSMGSALPEFNSVETSAAPQGPHAIARPLAPGTTHANGYQAAQSLNMPAQVSGNVSNHPSYGTGYAMGQYQQQSFGHLNQSRIGPGASMPTAYPSFAQHSPYMYYPAPYGQYNSGFSAQATQNHGMYERQGGASAGGLSQQHMGFQNPTRLSPGGMQSGSQFGQVQGIPYSSPTSSIPRGPPRKPKQSGHALWVGNLPSQTTVVALKDHFSREATKDIESLFLISKSSCAFINYRSEAACIAAMQRFHDSRFNGVRLVCRLRRSSAPGSGVPTGPSAMVGSQPSSSPPRTQQAEVEVENRHQDGTPGISNQDGADQAGATTSSSKYFVVKSLTLQDLELSVRNGIWATQSHNEDVLNRAFKTTENVFLVFSANKSGEYFGYARMTSPILEDGSQFVGTAPKPESIADAHDVPKSIPTPATEWAPRGRIIDDSARGTIFWEAELSESDVAEDAQEKEEQMVHGDTAAVAQSWGKPFKIEWVSTNRLPFYRTRGLRNPWNANREVKIARDGTELEPSVGERLVAMFHRMGPSNNGPNMMPVHPHMVEHGMHQMRPF